MTFMRPQDSSHFVRASAADRLDVGEGIARQLLGYGPDLMVCRVWFERGAIGSVHTHPHSQSSYIESGRFEIEIDGRKQVLGPGDGFYVAPHQRHGSVCLEAGSLLDSFSPAREDFLDPGEGR